MQRQLLQIGDWEVCASTCSLKSNLDLAEARITPKSMDVLIHLANKAGEVVSASELLDICWQGSIVSDHAVHKVIAELRSALGDDAHNPAYIRTVPKRGYSLVADVVTPSADTAPQTMPVNLVPTLASKMFLRVASSIGVVVLGLILVWSDIDLALNPGGDIRLAVLPFTQSGDIDSSHAFFVEGLTDSMLTGLAKLNELSSIVPGGDPAFSTSRRVAQTVGQSLGVEHVLSGNVHYSGDKARVTVQLVKTADGIQQYAEQFDLAETNIFQLQDDIVSNVVAALRIHLDEDQRQQMRDWGTTSALAYEQFQKGEFHNNQFNPVDFQLAIEHHQAAIALDPNFINAYLGVVTAANNYAVFSGDAKIAELSELVESMHRKVALLDPQSEVLHSIRAVHLRMNGNDYRIQETNLRQEILSGTAPDFALAHYALFLIGARLYDEAQQLLDVVAEVDPFEISPDEAWDYRVMVALPQDAIFLRKQQLQERPSHIGILGSIARNLVLTGAYEEANSYIARQIKTDIEGISSNFTRVVIGALTGEFIANPAALEEQYALGHDFSFNNGALAFMLGDVETGMHFWRSLTPVQKRRLINNVHSSEVYFPTEIVTNPAYQNLLEELDFGSSWQRTLMEGVMELEPVTGVKLSAAALQAYANEEPLYRNNLWTASQWASIDRLMQQIRTPERVGAD